MMKETRIMNISLEEIRMTNKQEAIEVVTDSGFECKIAKESADDWELLEILRKLDQNNPQLIVDAYILLLGEEQYNKLKDHLRKDGRVKASDMIKEFFDIMKKTNELKN